MISLGGTSEALIFEVADDGEGFDPARAPRGAGQTNMADRLAALSGALEVRSRPGAGTTVIGTIPIVAATSGRPKPEGLALRSEATYFSTR